MNVVFFVLLTLKWRLTKRSWRLSHNTNWPMFVTCIMVLISIDNLWNLDRMAVIWPCFLQCHIALKYLNILMSLLQSMVFISQL
jgi:hypothetical protein